MYWKIFLLLFLLSACNSQDAKQEKAFVEKKNPEKSIDYKLGKQLFNGNCKSCHLINKALVGPSLGGITKRRSKEWISKFIRNSQKLIHQGDSLAIEVWERYNKAVMLSFKFSDKEIEAVLIYIEENYKPNRNKK